MDAIVQSRLATEKAKQDAEKAKQEAIAQQAVEEGRIRVDQAKLQEGGVTGTVQEIGLFATTILTPDNVKTVVGNNKIFSDNIHNYSTNPVRRVERTAQLAN